MVKNIVQEGSDVPDQGGREALEPEGLEDDIPYEYELIPLVAGRQVAGRQARPGPLEGKFVLLHSLSIFEPLIFSFLFWAASNLCIFRFESDAQGK